LLEESSAKTIEDVVVAINVAQVTGGANDVVPGASFGLQKTGDVVEGAMELRFEVADVHAYAVLVDGSCAGDEQEADSADVDAHAARERARLGIGIGLVEDAEVGHGALLDRCVCDGLQNVSKCVGHCFVGSLGHWFFSLIPWLNPFAVATQISSPAKSMPRM